MARLALCVLLRPYVGNALHHAEKLVATNPFSFLKTATRNDSLLQSVSLSPITKSSLYLTRQEGIPFRGNNARRTYVDLGHHFPGRRADRSAVRLYGSRRRVRRNRQDPVFHLRGSL